MIASDVVELSISYQDRTRLIIYEVGTPMNIFYDDLKREFGIRTSIKLLDGSAEITSVKSFFNGRKLSIEVSEDASQVDDRASRRVDSGENVNSQSNVVELDEIIRMPYPLEHLLDRVNEWAVERKFKLCRTGGLKASENGFRTSLVCIRKSCKFRLTFKSNKEKKMFQLDENLAVKNNTHNHELEYLSKGIFNATIDAELEKFKAKMSPFDLTDHINKTFLTKFEVHQVRYRIDKMFEDSFGKPDEDAFKFVELAQEEVNKNGGYFSLSQDSSGRFIKAIYLSSVMKVYAEKFLDIVVIDTTYKRNRFNLPLVNVIGINNMGGNILLAFGLLNDETAHSYDWFFGNLKEAWKKDPVKIITDDCDELTQGIEKHFLSTRLLCGWHIQKNLVSKLSGLNKRDRGLYDLVLNLPFITCVQKFNKTLDKIYDSSKITTAELDYITLKLETKRKWAKCYIKTSFCGSVCTTSRIEGLHGVLKRHLNANSSLQKLFKCFREIEATQICKFHEEFSRHALVSAGLKSKPLTDISSNFSSYVYKKILPKFGKALNYTLEKSGNTNNSWKIFFEDKLQQAHTVILDRNILVCTCQESCFEGLPCRHELCVYIKASKHISNLNINMRWHNTYFDPSKLPKIYSDAEDDDLNVPSEPSQGDQPPINGQHVPSIADQQSSSSAAAREINTDNTQASNTSPVFHTVVVSNPVKVKTRGRPSGARNKSAREEKNSKKKTSSKSKGKSMSQGKNGTTLKEKRVAVVVPKNKISVGKIKDAPLIKAVRSTASKPGKKKKSSNSANDDAPIPKKVKMKASTTSTRSTNSHNRR